MKGRFIYNGPTGEAVYDPSEEFIKHVIFDTDEAHWKMGSGDSCIEQEDGKERLIFFYDEPYGIFMMRHPEYLVPYDVDVEIQTVTHNVGGEPMQIPTCSYVSKELAYQIIHSFMQTGEIPDFVKWVDLYDIDFEYEF